MPLMAPFVASKSRAALRSPVSGAPSSDAATRAPDSRTTFGGVPSPPSVPSAREAPATVGAAAQVNTQRAPASNQRALEAEEDRALVARAQAGDVTAFRRLIERYQRRAFTIAVALVRDEHDASELVQDAFLRVFKSLDSFQGGSTFFTWLYRIITNLSIDLKRKPGHRAAADLEDTRLDLDADADLDLPFLSRMDGADPGEVVRRREIAARLQAAFDGLPSYHRAVIVMREIDGLSYEEMAQVVGVSKGTIMSRLFHARQKLQRALADCYEEQVGGARQSRAPEDGR